jgi:DNA repair protein RadC
MTILEWPASERPRQKMQDQGPSALSDAELLAIIIGSGTKGQSAVDIGRRLLMKFGSIRSFLIADREECLKQLGIGPVRLVVLQAALELASRHYRDELQGGPALADPETANRYLVSRLRDLPYEVFCCLHLDMQHRLVAFEELFRGTLDSAHVYVREVARQVMVYNSASVIFAHNHPSGVPEPSGPDIELTQRLRNGLSYLDVQVLDHVVVGGRMCVSMAKRGLL